MSTTTDQTNPDEIDVDRIDAIDELQKFEEKAAADMAGRPPADTPGVRGYWPTIVFLGLAVLCVAAIFLVPGREIKAGIAIVLMMVLMFMKVPVALSLALPGLIGVYALAGFRAFDNVISGMPYHSVANWSLSVLPMFILMGLLLWASGLTEKLYLAARHWLAFLPGGLAVGTNVAGTALAAVSGSTVGTTFALARVGIPEMLRAGYDKKFAVGSVMVAGLPGQLIPPSTFLVIVAGLLETPVGPQLVAGIVPGLAVSLLFSIALIAMAVIRPKWAGKGVGGATVVKVSLGEKFRSLLWVLPIAALIFAVFGGMFSGLATATEAGAIGALGGLIICIVMKWKTKPWLHVIRGIITAVASVGAIFLMIIGANILGQLLSISGLGRLFSDFIIGLGLDRVGFLLVVMVIYLVLGTFMEPLPILLLTLPIIIPVLTALEIPLIWFGVFAVFMGELAILTPPVGILAFIIHSIAKDPDVNLGNPISLNDVFTALWIMFPIAVAFSVIFIFVPELATWLPSVMAGG